MTKENTQKNWFASWFDSPYYHKLYANRDFEEAEFFIQNLINYLDLNHTEKVLDLACGKGRHAFFLSQFGLDVTGLDLAVNSIAEAKQKHNHARLKFDVHDMREVYKNEKFQIVFNLFTSFGYFDEEDDNLKVLYAIHCMLEENGKLLIDFMNASKVIADLVLEEEKTCSETSFYITRNYDGKHIFKDIRFSDNSKQYHFTEKVQALKHSDFKHLLEKTGFEIEATFGDYNLNTFDENNSPRLIILARKK